MKQSKLKTIATVVGVLLVAVYVINQSLSKGDFNVFLDASKMMAKSLNPYHQWIFVSQDNYCLYLYSPLWALMLRPFTHIPMFVTNLLWLSANVFFMFRIFSVLKTYLEGFTLSTKQLNLIAVLSLAMSIRFVLYNFSMVQMTIFLLWSSLESIRAIERKQSISGGMLLALVINIKIMPVVFLPYLIYRGWFRGALSTVFFSILFLFLPALFIGWNTNVFYLKEWWSVINPTDAEQLIEPGLGMHSLTALVPSLLTNTAGDLPYARNLLHLTTESAILVMNVLRVALIMLSLYFLRWPPFIAVKSRIYMLRELSFLFLLIPLIFPHQHKYASVLALPAMYYLSMILVSSFATRKVSSRWALLLGMTILSFVLMTLTTDGLIGREWNKITQHYKLITWGELVLLISLFLALPRFAGKSTSTSEVLN